MRYSTSRVVLTLVAFLTLGLAGACNIPISEQATCGIGGGDSAAVGTGGGSAGGGTGVELPVDDGATFAYCSEACASQCSQNTINGFSPSVFKFVTIVQDDGTGPAGGWQSATTTLKFFRWTSLLPEAWSCTVTAEMPLRTVVFGVVSPQFASTATAGVATEASQNLTRGPDLPPGIYCISFKKEMKKLFDMQFAGLGATVL